MTGPTIEERLWALESERDIRELIHLYCDSADRRDWAAFRSVFHADSTHHHDEAFEGKSLDFAALGEGMIEQVTESHHHVGSVSIRVTGEYAVSEAYFTAHHLIKADAPTAIFPRHKAGVNEEWWVGGRYFDRFAFREGRWGIVHRNAIHDWERWETAETRGFVQTLFPLPDHIVPERNRQGTTR
jgi:hypothetical protein